MRTRNINNLNIAGVRTEILTLAQILNRCHVLHFLTAIFLVTVALSEALKIEAVCSTETFIST